MNLILFSKSEIVSKNIVRLTDRRFLHIKEILKPELGQVLTVGEINGLMGQGTITKLDSKSVEFKVTLNQKPPPSLPLTLIIALPRPPMLRKVLFQASMLGIKKIIIINFNRVEKSLWNSSSLKPEAIEEQLILGLEQSKDTVMPEVILKKGFKLFVEDELSKLIKGTTAIVAHPDQFSNLVIPAKAGISNHQTILIIGPEGGIIDYEIDHFQKLGIKTLSLGPRILRVETVLPYIVGKLF